MIMFENDFAEQGAIVNTETKNLSFIKMSILLNQLGVHNNLFPLALYDRDLKHVDPHDLKDDSLELKERIVYEAKINPWFAIRELVRVSASGTGGVPYILNRSNLAQAWCFFNSINTFQVMPRQIGKSLGTLTLCAIYVYIMAHHTNWGMFCKGNKLQYENVDRLKKLRDAFPKWMIHSSVDDTNNKEGIYYKGLENGLLTFVAQSDKQAAGDQARGQSFAVEHWDEICYYNNIDLSYDSATAGMDTAGEQAFKSGVPSAIIMTSTAGDIDDPRGRWCYRTACDAMRFTEQLYDLRDRQDLLDTVRMNSKNNFIYIEYSYKQLGKDDAWFERVTRNKSKRVIEKDYLNIWQCGSSSSIFPQEMLKKIRDSRKDPVKVTYYDRLQIKWYDDPDLLMKDDVLRMKPYVLGLDTSDNVGRDFTTGCMLDPWDLHPVCTFKCSITNQMFVARCVLDLMNKFPRMVFIPERNKLGGMFIDFVFAESRRDVFDPLTRIYNMYFQNYTKDTNVHGLDFTDGTVRKNFGFTTTKSSTSRDFLYSSVLMTSMKLVGDRLGDASIIDEISGISVRNGRVDHSEKGHDDLLIAFLLAAYFILYGANHHLYGISPDEFLSHVDNNTGDEIDPDLKKQQQELKNLYLDYSSKLKHCGNNFILKSAYERELQKLKAVLGDVPIEEDKIVSMEQAKQNAVKEGQKAFGMNMNEWIGYM